MKLTTFSLLSLCMAFVHGCEVNTIADEGCSDLFGYIAKITCSNTKCTCLNSDDEEVECTTITTEDDIGPADLNGAKCEEICSASTECIYFRWEKDGTVDSVESHCTLLDIHQCDAWLQCDRGHCVSGQAGCHGGDGTMPPVPDSVKCFADVQFVPGFVHWYCSFDNVRINIYGDESVPTGTICKTAHKCAFFNNGVPDVTGNSNANHLVVECNPDKKQDSPVVWGKAEECLYAVDAALDGDGAKLKDPKCETKADDLVLDAGKLNEPGVSLVCENVFTTNMDENKVTVTDPNACVLLCNSHHFFSFESELANDGTGVWNKYDVGSDIGAVLDKDEVKCWDFMKM